MKIKNSPFPHIIIENIYSEEEQKLIWRETEFLRDKLKGPEATNAALVDGSSDIRKKKGKGLFLDDIYGVHRDVSDILNITRKPFNNVEIKRALQSTVLGCYFKLFEYTNWDSTLLQYYEEGDYYDSHIDTSLFTIIYTYFKTPKKFTGGDLFFEEYQYYIPLENNQTVIFPSIEKHAVTKLYNVPVGEGRFSVANLVTWKI